MGGGKEKKKNGELSTAHQMKEDKKKLKQKFFQIKSPLKHILSKKLSNQL
jgi:hypothetical protein